MKVEDNKNYYNNKSIIKANKNSKNNYHKKDQFFFNNDYNNNNNNYYERKQSNNAYNYKNNNNNPNNINHGITNMDISNSFGQYNIEKSLYILITLFSCFLCWLIVYMEFFTKTYQIISYISLGLYAISIILYIFIFSKFEQDKILNLIPKELLNTCELIVGVNFCIRISLYISLHFQKINSLLLSAPYWMYVSILLLDIYFFFTTQKIFLLSSCSYVIFDKFKSIYNMILYYVFCIEEDDIGNNNSFSNNFDYAEIEDIESVY